MLEDGNVLLQAQANDKLELAETRYGNGHHAEILKSNRCRRRCMDLAASATALLPSDTPAKGTWTPPPKLRATRARV